MELFIFYINSSKDLINEYLGLIDPFPPSVCMPSCFSCVPLFATLWIVARQAPLSMGFTRQEYWSGLPFATLGDLPDPGIKPAFPALAGGFFTTDPPGRPFEG